MTWQENKVWEFKVYKKNRLRKKHHIINEAYIRYYNYLQERNVEGMILVKKKTRNQNINVMRMISLLYNSVISSVTRNQSLVVDSNVSYASILQLQRGLSKSIRNQSMNVLDIHVTVANILPLILLTSENTRGRSMKVLDTRVTSANLLLLHLVASEDTRNQFIKV